MEKLTMTVKEFAEYLGIGLNSAYEMTREEGFPARRVGRKILIIRSRVEEYLVNSASA